MNLIPTERNGKNYFAEMWILARVSLYRDKRFTDFSNSLWLIKYKFFVTPITFGYVVTDGWLSSSS
jgi:hypothetical protein